MKKTVLCLLAILFTKFNYAQKLEVVTRIDSSLDEASALENTKNSKLYWAIEDAGNNNSLYALDSNGDIVREIEITNADNEDWEDLTTDVEGNIYIGDFGNNDEERERFNIYKVNHEDLTKQKVKAKRIDFTLPDEIDSKDFEAFFLYRNAFYVFSKEKKKPIVISVPNQIGEYTAKLEYEFPFKGKRLKITSGDISPDGNTIALLNHDQLLIAEDFNNKTFNELEFKEIKFNHDSQKEGVCFISNTELRITDERDKKEGGKIYRLQLK